MNSWKSPKYSLSPTDLLLGFVICMTGCVTVPKTSTQLVETSGITERFCYSLPREDVGRRVESILTKCYGPAETMIPIGGAYVPIKADFQVLNEKTPHGNRFSVRNFVGFGYSAEVVTGADGCETTVQMYAVTGMWKSTFAAVDHAISTEEEKCP